MNTDAGDLAKPDLAVTAEKQREMRFIGLLDKHDVHRGSTVLLKEVVIDPNSGSDIKTDIFSGSIVVEPRLGDPLVLRNKDGDFNLDSFKISKFREKDGSLQFLAASGSVYEISIKNNTPEQLEERLIEHLDEQPATTKDIFANHKDLFVTSCEIDNKTWFFTANYSGTVMALVNSDENPSVFLPRFFKVSGSDHQFKSSPGYRSDMQRVKGKEDDKNHHYVQSAKLDSGVISVLQELPKKDNYREADLILGYMPIMAGEENNNTGRYLEDFSFSEEQVELKSESWRKIQKTEIYYLNLYNYLNSDPDQKNAKNFFNYLSKNAQLLGVDCKKMRNALQVVQNRNDNWKMRDIYSSKEPSLIQLGNKMKQVAQEIVEKMFLNEALYELMKKSNFIPDFSQKPIMRYVKTDGENEIQIEVFKTISPEGDSLCWEMASDTKGRVYVDNIYDSMVGIDSYGTPKKKCNMGMLIYKPEDYYDQTFSIPEKYIQHVDDCYVDISRLIELAEPVKSYKQLKGR